MPNDDSIWRIMLRSGELMEVKARDITGQSDFLQLGYVEQRQIESEKVTRRLFRKPLVETVVETIRDKTVVAAIRMDEVVWIRYPRKSPKSAAEAPQGKDA